MPYQLKESMKLEDQEEYCNAVIAGLEAAAELPAPKKPWFAPAVAAPWLQYLEELRAERNARDNARYLRARKGVIVDVIDTIHDAASKHFAGLVLLVSDRKAENAPYKDLYGDMNASRINRTAPDREIEAARTILSKAKAMQNPALEEALLAYASATDRLERALAEREAAELALRPFEIQRMQFLERLERQIEESEGLLRQSFPGADDLVRAVFSPNK